MSVHKYGGFHPHIGAQYAFDLAEKFINTLPESKRAGFAQQLEDAALVFPHNATLAITVAHTMWSECSPAVPHSKEINDAYSELQAEATRYDTDLMSKMGEYNCVQIFEESLHRMGNMMLAIEHPETWGQFAYSAREEVAQAEVHTMTDLNRAIAPALTTMGVRNAAMYNLWTHTLNDTGRKAVLAGGYKFENDGMQRIMHFAQGIMEAIPFEQRADFAKAMDTRVEYLGYVDEVLNGAYEEWVETHNDDLGIVADALAKSMEEAAYTPIDPEEYDWEY